jgi:hypothetical protein
MSKPAVTLPDPTVIAIEDIPAAIGELERVKALLYARLITPAPASPAEPRWYDPGRARGRAHDAPLNELGAKERPPAPRLSAAGR